MIINGQILACIYRTEKNYITIKVFNLLENH
jgi:hypothetical protein